MKESRHFDFIFLFFLSLVVRPEVILFSGRGSTPPTLIYYVVVLPFAAKTHHREPQVLPSIHGQSSSSWVKKKCQGLPPVIVCC